MNESAAATQAEQSQTASELPVPEEKSGMGMGALISGIFIVIALIASIGAIIHVKKKKYMKTLWAILAVILSTLALILCIVGAGSGTLIAKPEGDPQQYAVEFMDSITSGNYQQAYSLLKGYSSLGLENEPADEAAEIMYEALKSSYSYSLTGECIVDLLEARQQIQFTYLDLPSTEADIQAKTMDELEIIVNSRSKSAVYDENNNYRPEVTREAYTNAVKAVLASPEKYYISTGIQLQLEYTGGAWSVIPAESLLTALSGNTSK